MTVCCSSQVQLLSRKGLLFRGTKLKVKKTHDTELGLHKPALAALRLSFFNDTRFKYTPPKYVQERYST